MEYNKYDGLVENWIMTTDSIAFWEVSIPPAPISFINRSPWIECSQICGGFRWDNKRPYRNVITTCAWFLSELSRYIANIQRRTGHTDAGRLPLFESVVHKSLLGSKDVKCCFDYKVGVGAITSVVSYLRWQLAYIVGGIGNRTKLIRTCEMTWWSRLDT